MNEKTINEKSSSLGERLYLLRTRHGITQEELAVKLNVSRQTISNWENDKVKLDLDKAVALCRLYEISMDELFLGKEQSPTLPVAKPPFILIVTVVLLVFFAALTMISIVFLATTPIRDDTSAVLYLGKSAWWLIPLFFGTGGCIFLMWRILKYFKNK